MNKSMKIMIAYDASKYTELAIQDLQFAGLPRVGRALIVSVQESLTNSTLSSIDLVEKAVVSRRILSTVALLEQQTLEAAEFLKKQMAEAAENVGLYLPEWEIATKFVSGVPAPTLLREADFLEPDLIVLGSHGRTILGRFFLGSVSTEIAEKARCPIRIVRGETLSPINFNSRIIIAIDDSDEAETVVRHIGNRVWSAETEIRLAVIEDENEPLKRANLLTKKQMTLEWAVEQLQAIGLRVSLEFVEGDAKHSLLEAANEWNANTIFIAGNRSDKFGLDETAMHIVNNARCAVEIVR